MTVSKFIVLITHAMQDKNDWKVTFINDPYFER